ncbi:MAG: ImmA/IrrE family metallo-endopeptidase [Actinomycetaceae bacterium]|nr:ImmA/IrrE family metallo-endopeptidase [Actinomycetaceae bacterium]
MDSYAQYEALKAELDRLGVRLVETPLKHYGVWGLYVHATKTVATDPSLTARQRTATLAHEYTHALRGDDGHQSPAVERLVSEEAARLLIDARDYAQAEELYGADEYAIAAELDVALAVVQHYRSWLSRSRV